MVPEHTAVPALHASALACAASIQTHPRLSKSYLSSDSVSNATSPVKPFLILSSGVQLPYLIPFSVVWRTCRLVDHSVGKHTGEMRHHLVLLSLACPHGPRGVLAAWSFPGRITASPWCWALPAARCFCRISKMILPWSIYTPVFFFYMISSLKAVWGYFNIFFN